MLLFVRIDNAIAKLYMHLKFQVTSSYAIVTVTGLNNQIWMKVTVTLTFAIVSVKVTVIGVWNSKIIVKGVTVTGTWKQLDNLLRIKCFYFYGIGSDNNLWFCDSDLCMCMSPIRVVCKQ